MFYFELMVNKIVNEGFNAYSKRLFYVSIPILSV